MKLMRRLLVGTAIVSLGAAVAIPYAAPAQASTDAEPPKGEHCLIETSGVDEANNLIVTETSCFDSFAEVLTKLGADDVAADARPANLDRSQIGLRAIIGVHYDGGSYDGDSFTVTGSTCTGGGLNVSSAWNDRISSTVNGCYRIEHFEHGGFAGATFNTYGSGGSMNGSTMNNKTTSIKYWS